ncbi:MAG: multiheme c-type cytochrome [Candidatus Heimdallarchaeota archaeon]
MNDSEQMDDLINKSRWSAKRVVLMYWFALMFLGGGVAVGLGFQMTNPTFEPASTFDHSGISDPWHPENCSGCHSTQFAEWDQTDHSQGQGYYNETHVQVANRSYLIYTIAQFNATCAECRTTRWMNDSGTYSYWDMDITCASCHEPGVVNHTATSCAACHRSTGEPGDMHYRQGEDFMLSEHATSLDDVLSSDHPSDYCLHCKSGQGTYADDMTQGEFNLTIGEPGLSSIVCATCHDPHSSENHYQLRNESINDLCGRCHGGGGRHVEADLIADAGSAHQDMDCITCHGYQLMNATDLTDWRINHTWTLDLPYTCGQNTTTCHTDGAAQVTALTAIQADFEDLLSDYETLLENVTAMVDTANETSGVDQAEVDSAYDLIDDAGDLAGWATYDNSEGFHNNAFVKAKLVAATAKLNQAYGVAQAAIDDASEEEDDDEGIPGFVFLGALMTLSVLGVVALFLRKRE